MRRWIIFLLLLLLLSGRADALELEAPEVPSSGALLMPEENESFGEAVLEILGDALGYLRPDLQEAAASCAAVLAAAVALSLLHAFPGGKKGTGELTGALLTAGLLLHSARSLVALGMETVETLSGYGKLLLPVMTAALAAQGGVTSAAALYTGTACFNALLGGLIAHVLLPVIDLYLALAVGCAALGDHMLKKFRDFVKWAVSWGLKTILYVYTGYVGMTGVVSGATDAGALKAAKLTISGVVPVVGSILADASEAVLVSAGTVKNAAGVYGMLAIIAVWIGPFLRIGAHYLILKLLGLVCGAFDVRSVAAVVEDFSAAMGLLLAMTGAVCLMLIIGTICFMKGVGA